jgi:hypothetical protein
MDKFRALWEIIQRASPYLRSGYALAQELRNTNLHKFASTNSKLTAKVNLTFPSQHYLPTAGVALNSWGRGGE